MRIYHNQLINTLNQGFKPIWLVFGDEPWQKNDSLQSIKQTAQQQGFTELIRFTADDKFDWQILLQEYQTLSLFSTQRIIEVELTTAKIGDAGSKALLSLVEQLHQDVLLIFHGPKLDAPTANRKWFKSLSAQGCYLPIYEIETKGLHQWLMRQARQMKVNLAPDVVNLLIELFEGNLPALAQELQKLSLLFGDKKITIEDGEPLVIKQAKFNPFQIIDALLMGNCEKCVTMLDQLQQQGTAPGQLIWVFHKEFQQINLMLEEIKQGMSRTELFKKHRVWDKRKPFYQHALTQIKIENIQHALARLAQIDLISKTSSEFNPFILLADVCITLFHGQTMSKFALDYEYS